MGMSNSRGHSAVERLERRTLLAGSPSIEWSTYLGGYSSDSAGAVAVDASGNIYVAGDTSSSAWFTGGPDTTLNSFQDAFVARLNPDGTLAWGTYLGGNDDDRATAIALAPNGDIYVAGGTNSKGWITGQTEYGGMFVVRLRNDGTIAWSNYLSIGSVNSITVDLWGNVYLAGSTYTTDLAVGGFDTTHGGNNDAYIAKLNADGSFAWSSYMGGWFNESIGGVATDSQGNLYVAGVTNSNDWIGYLNGPADGFLARINTDGSLGWCRYIGGSYMDGVYEIAIDNQDNIYAAGTTMSSGWAHGGFDSTLGGTRDGLIAKYRPDGTQLWASHLGGSGYDDLSNIAADAEGNLYAVGITDTPGWAPAFPGSSSGYEDGFISRINADGTLAWSRSFGGTKSELPRAVFASSAGSVYIVGETGSSGWISGGFDSTYAAYDDGFLIKLASPNYAPADIVLSASSILENSGPSASIGVLSTVDADPGDSHTYALVEGGTHNDLFYLDGETVRARDSFDYESGQQYAIRVRSTDSKGASVDRTFEIDVVNLNEAPAELSLSSTELLENTWGAVGTFVVVDPEDDAVELSLSPGQGADDNDLFSIEAGSLMALAPFNHETRSSYQVRVRATDTSGLWLEQCFTINIVDIDERPEGIVLSANAVSENQSNAAIGILTVLDPDPYDVYTLSLPVGHESNHLFVLVGNELWTAGELDAESANGYVVAVRAEDPGGDWIYHTFAIQVDNINEAPDSIALSNATLDENEMPGSTIGVLSAHDPDWNDVVSFTLSGADAAHFRLEGNVLQSNATFNHEARSTYTIIIEARDAGGLSYQQQFTISIDDVNEAPSVPVLSSATLDENQMAGTAIGVLSAHDPDWNDVISFALSGADAANFRLEGNVLQSNAIFNHEERSTYTIIIEARDAGGLRYQQQFTIAIRDVNESPGTPVFSSTSVPENRTGALVGTVSADDPEGSLVTYSLVAGALDNALFDLVGNELIIRDAVDFETRNSYRIRLRASDPLGFYTQSDFTVSVIDIDDPATDLVLSSHTVPEYRPEWPFGSLSVADQDSADVYTFALVEGHADNAAFMITNWTVRAGYGLDFETKATYDILVRAQNQYGVSIDRAFQIQVTDVAEAPTSISIDHTHIRQESGRTLVGTLSGHDPDAGDTLTFAIVGGDTAFFELDGQRLYSQGLQHDGSYVLVIRATDGTGLWREQSLSFTVETNRPPQAISLSATAIFENQAPDSLVALLSAFDPDPAEELAFTLIGGDTSHFHIAGNELRSSVAFDYEARSTYEVVIRVEDLVGASVDQAFTISILDVNNPQPLLITGSVGDDVITLTQVGSRYQIAVNGLLSHTWFDDVSAITIDALAGNDLVEVGLGVGGVTLYGGAGRDTLTGGEFADLIYGGDDDDVLNGRDGSDTIYGNFGNDVIMGGLTRDELLGGLGNDTITAGDGPDTVYGGDGRDILRGGKGADYIEGRGKADTLYGGDGNDTLYGQAGDDLIFGDTGDDRIYAHDGTTPIFHDTLWGGAGHDVVHGNPWDTLAEIEESLLA